MIVKYRDCPSSILEVPWVFLCCRWLMIDEACERDMNSGTPVMFTCPPQEHFTPHCDFSTTPMNVRYVLIETARGVNCALAVDQMCHAVTPPRRTVDENSLVSFFSKH